MIAISVINSNIATLRKKSKFEVIDDRSEKLGF